MNPETDLYIFVRDLVGSGNTDYVNGLIAGITFYSITKVFCIDGSDLNKITDWMEETGDYLPNAFGIPPKHELKKIDYMVNKIDKLYKERTKRNED